MNCHGPVTKLKIGTFFMSGYVSCNNNACFIPPGSKYSAGAKILVSKINSTGGHTKGHSHTDMGNKRPLFPQSRGTPE